MSVFVASLASGSNGNCYYIGNREEGILVDAGISCREIEKRMRALAIDPATLRAVFVSHEHTDHITGIPSLVKKFRIPLYITPRTYRACGFIVDESLLFTFSAFEAVQVGSFFITAFPKWHDAIDPHSFIIRSNGVTTGVFTDIGAPCKNVLQYFKHCHAIFLETNYDETMLANSRYPVFLRNRISGKHGHLSNGQALELFMTQRADFMTHVFLSHLSRENNDAAMVEALFTNKANGVRIIHASRNAATPLYEITATAVIPPQDVVPGFVKKKQLKGQMQLSLF